MVFMAPNLWVLQPCDLIDRTYVCPFVYCRCKKKKIYSISFYTKKQKKKICIGDRKLTDNSTAIWNKERHKQLPNSVAQTVLKCEILTALQQGEEERDALISLLFMGLQLTLGVNHPTYSHEYWKRICFVCIWNYLIPENRRNSSKEY